MIKLFDECVLGARDDFQHVTVGIRSSRFLGLASGLEQH